MTSEYSIFEHRQSSLKFKGTATLAIHVLTEGEGRVRISWRWRVYM